MAEEIVDALVLTARFDEASLDASAAAQLAAIRRFVTTASELGQAIPAFRLSVDTAQLTTAQQAIADITAGIATAAREPIPVTLDIAPLRQSAEQALEQLSALRSEVASIPGVTVSADTSQLAAAQQAVDRLATSVGGLGNQAIALNLAPLEASAQTVARLLTLPPLTVDTTGADSAIRGILADLEAVRAALSTGTGLTVDVSQAAAQIGALEGDIAALVRQLSGEVALNLNLTPLRESLAEGSAQLDAFRLQAEQALTGLPPLRVDTGTAVADIHSLIDSLDVLRADLAVAGSAGLRIDTGAVTAQIARIDDLIGSLPILTVSADASQVVTAREAVERLSASVQGAAGAGIPVTLDLALLRESVQEGIVQIDSLRLAAVRSLAQIPSLRLDTTRALGALTSVGVALNALRAQLARPSAIQLDGSQATAEVARIQASLGAIPALRLTADTSQLTAAQEILDRFIAAERGGAILQPLTWDIGPFNAAVDEVLRRLEEIQLKAKNLGATAEPVVIGGIPADAEASIAALEVQMRRTADATEGLAQFFLGLAQEIIRFAGGADAASGALDRLGASESAAGAAVPVGQFSAFTQEIEAARARLGALPGALDQVTAGMGRATAGALAWSVGLSRAEAQLRVLDVELAESARRTAQWGEASRQASLTPFARGLENVRLTGAGTRAELDKGVTAFARHNEATRKATTALSILAAQSVGASGPLARLAESALLLGAGSTGVLVGAGLLLGVVKVFEAITSSSRVAKQATDDAIASLLKLHDAQRDPVRVGLENTGEAARRLDELRGKIIALTDEQRNLEAHPLVFTDRGGDQTAARLIFIQGRLVELGHEFARTAIAASAGGLDVATQQATQLSTALKLGTASAADLNTALAQISQLNAAAAGTPRGAGGPSRLGNEIADLEVRNQKQQRSNDLVTAALSPIQQQVEAIRSLREAQGQLGDGVVKFDTADAQRQLAALDEKVQAILAVGNRDQRALALKVQVVIDVERAQEQLQPLQRELDAIQRVRLAQARLGAGAVQIDTVTATARLDALEKRLIDLAKLGGPDAKALVLKFIAQVQTEDLDTIQQQVQAHLRALDVTVSLTTDTDPLLQQIRQALGIPIPVGIAGDLAISQAEALRDQIGRTIANAGGEALAAPGLAAAFAQLTAKIKEATEAPIVALLQGTQQANDQLGAALAAIEAQRALSAGALDTGAGVADQAAALERVAPLIANLRTRYAEVTAQIEAGTAGTARQIELLREQATVADQLRQVTVSAPTPVVVTQIAPLEEASRALLEAQRGLDLAIISRDRGAIQAARASVLAAATDMDVIAKGVGDQMRRLGLDAATVKQIVEAIAAAFARVGRNATGPTAQVEAFVHGLGQFSQIVGGIEQVGRSFGVIDEGSARALQSVQDLAEGIGRIASGDVIGGIIQGVSALGGLFGKSASQQEHDRILAENNQRLGELAISLDRSLQGAGGVQRSASITGSVEAAIQGAVQLPKGRGITEAIQKALDDASLTLQQFEKIVKDTTGIEILNSKGKLLSGTLEQADAAFQAVIKGITTFGASIADQQRVLETRDALGLGPNAGQPANIAALNRTREIELQGLHLDPATEARIAGLNLATEEGRKAFLVFNQMLFTLAQNGQLTAEQLGAFASVTELLGPINDAANGINALADATSAATAAMIDVPRGFRQAALAFEAQVPGVGPNAPKPPTLTPTHFEPKPAFSVTTTAGAPKTAATTATISVGQVVIQIDAAGKNGLQLAQEIKGHLRNLSNADSGDPDNWGGT